MHDEAPTPCPAGHGDLAQPCHSSAAIIGREVSQSLVYPGPCYAAPCRSHANPGCSWRVGVSPVRDPVAQLALGDLGQEMLAERTVPAVMTVTPHLDAPQLDGAKEVLPSELRFRIELWRADLLSGVLEVDASGNVANSGFVKSLPVYSPHRLLGLPASLVQGTALAPLLGCAMDYSSLVNALFTEGGMSGRQSMTQRAGAKGGLRSTHRQKKEVGPLHTIKLRHGLDGQELELQVGWES